LRKIHSFPLKIIVENTRPVPLHFFFQSNNEIFYDFSKLKESDLLRKILNRPTYQEKYVFSKPNKTKSLLKDISSFNGYPCVYFSFSRRRCEELAQETGQFDFLNSDEKNRITKMFDGLLDKFNISSSPHINFLGPLIKRGIAYHHAGLLPTLKEIIERLFTTGLIKLIFTTETFALGINMPAKTVIFNSLSKFYGRYHGYLKTRDFYQMAGRAGRRGIDKEGFVFSRINPSHIDIPSLEKIIYGKYEPIQSQLNSCYATILNLYKIMADKIYDIYPKSFHFHQGETWKKKEVLSLLKRKVSLLKNLGYIREAEITQKAQLAAKVYSFELAIGELFEAGFLDNLDEEDLFVFVAALVYEPRKGEKKPKLTKKTKALKYRIDKFIKDIHKIERRFRIYPLSKKFFFYLSGVCRMWFAGASFPKISQYSTIDEGEIVRYFRMAIQVLREINTSSAITDSLKRKISNCLRKVNRDVVDAERQLRQKI